MDALCTAWEACVAAATPMVQISCHTVGSAPLGDFVDHLTFPEWARAHPAAHTQLQRWCSRDLGTVSPAVAALEPRAHGSGMHIPLLLLLIIKVRTVRSRTVWYVPFRTLATLLDMEDTTRVCNAVNYLVRSGTITSAQGQRLRDTQLFAAVMPQQGSPTHRALLVAVGRMSAAIAALCAFLHGSSTTADLGAKPPGRPSRARVMTLDTSVELLSLVDGMYHAGERDGVGAAARYLMHTLLGDEVELKSDAMKQVGTSMMALQPSFVLHHTDDEDSGTSDKHSEASSGSGSGSGSDASSQTPTRSSTTASLAAGTAARGSQRGRVNPATSNS